MCCQRVSAKLEADWTHVVKWWINASHALHPDMRSHAGGIITLGKVQ